MATRPDYISAICPQCSAKLKAPMTLAGRMAKCKCGAAVQIPDQTTYVQVSPEEVRLATSVRDPAPHFLSVGTTALLMAVLGSGLYFLGGTIDADSDVGMILFAVDAVMILLAPILGAVGMFRRQGRAWGVIAILVSLCTIVAGW